VIHHDYTLLTVALCISLIKVSESTECQIVSFGLYQFDDLNEAEIECEL